MARNKTAQYGRARSSLVLFGRDSWGNWVFQDQDGLCCGFFHNRAEALKFAMFDNQNRPRVIIRIPGTFEPDMVQRRGSALVRR